MSGPALGSPAPDFAARNQHGQTVTLSGLRGQPAVLVFFPWAFTGVCTGELASIRDAHEQFVAAGARVLAISCDAMFSMRVFAESERLPFDLLSDHWPHGAIARSYGIFDAELGCAVRGSFVLDAEGCVRWSTVSTLDSARDIGAHLAALRG